MPQELASRNPRPPHRIIAVGPRRWFTPAVASLVWLVVGVLVSDTATGQKLSAEEKALALYADAANLQNGGAIGPAIESWDQFLDQYSDHPKAAEAAHYLGVCHMQSDPPQPAVAAQAFEKALKSKSYGLREESLANLGWCLYSAGTASEKPDDRRLKKSIDAFSRLQKEFPDSEFIDRSLFYRGEAAFGMDDSARAVKFYNQLLALPKASQSPFRCDALYARGVALESLGRAQDALASFDQLLSACADNDLVTDVHLRRGDLSILAKSYDDAIASFEAAIESSDAAEDRSYAIYRQGFAEFAAGRPAKAAKRYERLLDEYPDSRYAAKATLAAGQSAYRGGEVDAASQRFAEVLEQGNRAAATEAAHWLARIGLTTERPLKEIETMIRAQVDRGVEGDFELELKLDLAEIVSMDASRIEESLKLFESVYRQSPQAPTAPRALYNAAFSAFQGNKLAQALSLSKAFAKAFPDHALANDVAFIAAEASWGSGNQAAAAKQFASLAIVDPKQNPQHAQWVLRALEALTATDQLDAAIQLYDEQVSRLPSNPQGEAGLLIGNAALSAGEHKTAIRLFSRSADQKPSWPRADEARLMSGQAHLVAGNENRAVQIWNRLIKSAPQSRMASQAQYKLASVATANGNHEQAARYYQQILSANNDPGLIPYAQYSRGYGLLQMARDDQAVEVLTQLREDYPQHSVSQDALLSLGIAFRNLEKYKEAQRWLTEFLETQPAGIGLGHALYELALVDQAEKRPLKAAESLRRLIKEVPRYPDMDKVLYELGWSVQEAGKDDEAVEHFANLIDRYPNTSLAAEASYFVGQRDYRAGRFQNAANRFEIAAKSSDSDELAEKALYRLGWSHFKAGQWEPASRAFSDQYQRYPDGRLAFDAITMVGETHFKTGDYAGALGSYEQSRALIRKNQEDGRKLRDASESQIRELALLHGGQAAAQLERYEEAVAWYDELRSRFPSTAYLPQLFYETGSAHQQLGDHEAALKFFSEVADNYRNEVAARARFMMGEIYFGDRKFDKAIPEFQRLMFGYGADQAPTSVKDWQAKAGFEAGRCSELLASTAATPKAKAKAIDFAKKFFDYVVQKHPQHDLVAKSKDRLEALQP